MAREILVMGLFLVGAFLMFLAGLGLLRMPDLFLRMSATSKAGSLGAGLVLLGAVVFFQDWGITARALATIVFLFLTAPVAAHMIGRAAYFDGVPLWKGTVRDDLRGHYKLSTHRLETQVTPPTDKESIDAAVESIDDH